MQGSDDDETGFLGWENMVLGIHRTDVPFIGDTPEQTLETLTVLMDACRAGALGHGPSALVAGFETRRRIQRAAHLLGFELAARMVPDLASPAPHYGDLAILGTDFLPPRGGRGAV